MGCRDGPRSDPQARDVTAFSKESTPPGDYDFVANVKDLAVDPISPEGTLREYRLYVEVTVKGETYAFSWDKRHEGSLLKQIQNVEGDLSTYLGGGEVHSVPQAKLRNAKLVERTADRQALAPRFQQVIALMQPGGEIYEFLRLYASMFGENSKLDASGTLGGIQDVLDGGGGSGKGKGKGN